MNKKEAIRLLDETFNAEFDLDRYTKFIKELFNDFTVNIQETQYIANQYVDYISEVHKIGEYKDESKKTIEVLAVKLKRTSSRDRARTMQRNFVANWLSKEDNDAALVAFYGDDYQDWRFSFVKMEYNLIKNENGKVKIEKELTPAKRYSFLVGVNEPNHTCRSQFLNLIMEEDSNPSLRDIEQAFSIDNVTKEFFEKYKELFLSLKESLEEVISRDAHIREEFEEKEISTIDFAKKLLGQIVFIYFLQKKGWLGVGKDDDGNFREWGTGPKNFMRKLFNKEIVSYDNFFNDILEPLFYEALATERDDDYYSRFKCKIPFLNGGLFEPINDYDWAGTDIVIDNSIFENILNTFDRFNFTVKEDEPLEKEVAVDPEMLGKVFENLLEVRDRKSKGAFYTPREIVHYMCQQSLINYLETNTGIEHKDIEKFVQMGDFILDHIIKEQKQPRESGGSYAEGDYGLSKPIRDNYRKIDRLLRDIKIVDPAVGSGAFLVGMMNEIVKARSILSIYFNPEEQEKRTTYNLKREIIENCLYGVDIEPSAVQICKLRFWLSLIVDESDMKNIKPLPNLDYKIMCGNSLLEEFEGIKLFDERLLGEVKKDYSFEVERIDKQIGELYMEKRKVLTGKSSGQTVKDINKEIARLKKKKKELLSAPKDKVRTVTLDEALQKKIRESQRKLKEYKKLQKQYFNEQNRGRKAELREEMDRIEWELIEATLKEQGNGEAMEKLKHYRKTRSKPFFLWKLHFAKVFQRLNPGFDVVIANPPYGIVYDEYLKSIYERLFDSFRRNNDIYIAFFERGYELLRNDGQLTYITPNTYLNGDYFKMWRKKLTSLAKIHEIIDYKSVPIFEDPTVFVSVIVTSKGVDFPYEFKLKYYKSPTEPDTNKVRIKKPSDNKLKPKDAIIEKINEYKSVVSVDKLFYVKDVGFNYWTKGRGKTRGGDSIGKRLFYKGKKKSDNDIPFLKGRNVFKWHISSQNNYLRHNYRELLDPSVDTFRFSEEFLRINPKLIYRQTSNKIVAAIDTNSYLLDKTVHLVVPKFEHQLNLKYILALFNSTLFDYIYHYISQENTDRAFAQVKTTYIKKLPILKISRDEQQPFIALVDKILSITDDSDYLENPEKQAKVKKLEKEIDHLVYKLYDLTPEEIKIVEEFGEK